MDNEELRTVPRGVNAKDTRRWCRGREGIEHQWQWVWQRQHWVSSRADANAKTYEWYREICNECGRKSFRLKKVATGETP